MGEAPSPCPSPAEYSDYEAGEGSAWPLHPQSPLPSPSGAPPRERGYLNPSPVAMGEGRRNAPARHGPVKLATCPKRSRFVSR